MPIDGPFDQRLLEPRQVLHVDRRVVGTLVRLRLGVGGLVEVGAAGEEVPGAGDNRHAHPVVDLRRHQREADLVIELLVERVLRLRAVEPHEEDAILPAADIGTSACGEQHRWLRRLPRAVPSVDDGSCVSFSVRPERRGRTGLE